MTDVTKGMQELLSRLPKTDTYPFRSVLNPEYTQEHIALSLTPANLLLALLRAKEAQEIAVSYRDFKVGAAVVGLAFKPSRFKIMTGVNVKPDEESNMNVHAEQVALQKARDDHFDAISIVAVVGNTQSDKQSGKEMPTLHPCGLCRGIMTHDPMMHHQATLIVSALPDFSSLELYSLDALNTYHETHDTTGITQIDLPRLSIFDPVIDTGEPIQPGYVESYDADARIWENAINDFLLQRRLELLN